MILRRPEGAWALYVLAHGAGAGMRHPFLEALSAALNAEGVATLRYEFPYMEAGGKRIDPKPVLHARVREAAAAAREQGLPLLAGGKSLLQYPATDGAIRDPRPFIEKAHAQGALVVMAANLCAFAR